MELMGKLKEMQAEMERTRERLDDIIVFAETGGGMVKVKVSGDLVVQSIEIDPDAVDPEDVEMLQDMVLAAINEGIRAAQARAESKMGGITGGLGGGGRQFGDAQTEHRDGVVAVEREGGNGGRRCHVTCLCFGVSGGPDSGEDSTEPKELTRGTGIDVDDGPPAGRTAVRPRVGCGPWQPSRIGHWPSATGWA